MRRVPGASNWEESSINCTTTKHNSKIILDKKESLKSEKQILVDPISLRGESSAANNNMHQTTMMYPVTTGPKLEVVSVPLHHLQPAPIATKSRSSKFMSSLPPNSASASASPQQHFDLTFTKHNKKKNKCKKHQGMVSPLARQQSVALNNLEKLRESHLRRSKSCGEGRASQPISVDDFDLWSYTDHQRDDINNETEAVVVRVEKRELGKTKTTPLKKGGKKEEDKFKCGACLFLPGLGKGRTVRAREVVDKRSGGGGMAGHADILSQRVSLEKFECGSWRSSAVIHCDEDGDTTSNLFFDLPVELMRCSSVKDTETPITTGFLFDNYKDDHHHHHWKGVLKSTSTTTMSVQTAGKKSHESCNSSSRHEVRFSTSSPNPITSPTSSCITPRLRKARDDFNAFLEAQSS